MVKKVLFLSAVSAMVLGLAQNSKAEDVVVDLSVLNSLSPSTPALIDNQPLFPPAVKREAPVKKAAPKKVEKPAEPKMVEMKVEPVAEPVVEPEVAEDTTVSEDVQKIKDEAPQVEKEVVSPEILTSEESAKLETTPIVVDASNPEASFIPSEGITPPEQKLESILAEDREDAVVEADKIIDSRINDIEEAKTEDSSAPTPLFEPLLPVGENGETVAMPEPEVKMNQITFMDEETELDLENKNKVDSIISAFEDAKNNKIGIIAYNFDDNGEDAFKKKRQSLNRAIEIRTYLLNKGYKNFSIKVVNISDNLAKKNTVDIEEIK